MGFKDKKPFSSTMGGGFLTLDDVSEDIVMARSNEVAPWEDDIYTGEDDHKNEDIDLSDDIFEESLAIEEDGDFYIPKHDNSDDSTGDFSIQTETIQGPEIQNDSPVLDEDLPDESVFKNDLYISDLSPNQTMESTFFTEEDEGPIALSDEELDGILSEDTTPALGDEFDLSKGEELPESPAPSAFSAQEEFDLMPQEPAVEEPRVQFDEVAESQKPKPSQAADIETGELRKMIAYLDNLLGELPDEVIEQFARSEYFSLYQKMMEKLGL